MRKNLNNNYYSIDIMGVKNTFNVKTLKKAPKFKNLKYNSYIVWTDEIEKSNDHDQCCIDMQFYFEDLHDIGHLTIAEYKCYLVLGVCEINCHLKLQYDTKEQQYIYLITDPEYKNLYISVEKSHPLYWFKFSTKNEFYERFDEIYELFNPKEYVNNFDNTIRGFIGTSIMLNANMDNLVEYIIQHQNSEFLVWGSKWEEHPNRTQYVEKAVTTKNHVIYTRTALKQRNEHVSSMSLRTRFSKSIITIEDHEGAYVISIQYNPAYTPQIETINKELGREYPLDVPADAIITIAELAFVTHLGLMRLEPLQKENYIMASLVANSKLMFDELLKEVQELITKHATSKDEEFLEMLKHCLKDIHLNISLYDLFTDEKTGKIVEDKVGIIRTNKNHPEEVERQLKEYLEPKLESIQDAEFKKNLVTIIKNLII